MVKQEGDRLDNPQCMESPVSCHVGTQSSHCFSLCVYIYIFFLNATFYLPSGWLMRLLTLFVCLSFNVF